MSTIKLLSIAEVVETTGLGRTKVYEEIRQDRIRSIKVGSRRLVPAAELDRWIMARLEEASQ